MKYAILSDVHANVTALRAVLADARQQGADQVICLGDVVGYGPDAEAAVDIVRSEVDVCLMGNHDAAVSAVIIGRGFSLSALRGVARHREETSVGARQYLSQLPYMWAREGFACVHGDFVNPEAFRYITTIENARESLNACAERVLFVGHTHASAMFRSDDTGRVELSEFGGDVELKADCRYVINVGSVGYPRHDIDSTYCIFDDEAQVIALRRVVFDYNAYELEMQAHAAPLPVWFEAMKRRQLCGRLKD